MNMNVKWHVPVLFFLISTSAFADEATLVECKARSGRLVEVGATTEEYLRIQTFSKLAASLTGNYETPVILLDVENLKALPVEFQNFVFLHECAHHELDHVSTDARAREMALKKFDANRELEADCRAIERLILDEHYNYGDREVNVILDVLKQELGASSVVRDSQGKVVKKGIFKYYMPIEERNEALKKCHIDAVAKKRGQKKV